MLISDFIDKLQSVKEKHEDLLITLPFLTQPVESLTVEISEAKKSVSGKQIKSCWFEHDYDEVDLLLKQEGLFDDDVLSWEIVDSM